MPWTHLNLAFLAALLANQPASWFFFGHLFHDRHKLFPEVSRIAPGASETSAIVLSLAAQAVSIFVFIVLLGFVGATSMERALAIAGLVWLCGPMTVLISNYLFVKQHPLILLAHCLGWFAQLAIPAVAVGLIVG